MHTATILPGGGVLGRVLERLLVELLKEASSSSNSRSLELQTLAVTLTK